jgi:hypothetical protein
MKILIDFPDDQVKALEVICNLEGISRSQAIRQAVASHVDQRTSPISAFGLWKSSKVDGLKHQTAIRDEW